MIPVSNREMVSRRRFLSYLTVGMGAAISTVLGLPVVGYLLSPLLKPTQSNEWSEVDSVDSFAIGEPKLTHFASARRDAWLKEPGHIAVYVVRHSEEEFTVFDIHCTHLGCPVQWNTGPQRYFSPCHGGVFDAEGKVLAGPPPRPLDRYETKVENDKLYVGRLYRVNENLERLT